MGGNEALKTTPAATPSYDTREIQVLAIEMENSGGEALYKFMEKYNSVNSGEIHRINILGKRLSVKKEDEADYGDGGYKVTLHSEYANPGDLDPDNSNDSKKILSLLDTFIKKIDEKHIKTVGGFQDSWTRLQANKMLQSNKPSEKMDAYINTLSNSDVAGYVNNSNYKRRKAYVEKGIILESYTDNHSSPTSMSISIKKPIDIEESSLEENKEYSILLPSKKESIDLKFLEIKDEIAYFEDSNNLTYSFVIYGGDLYTEFRIEERREYDQKKEYESDFLVFTRGIPTASDNGFTYLSKVHKDSHNFDINKNDFAMTDEEWNQFLDTALMKNLKLIDKKAVDTKNSRQEKREEKKKRALQQLELSDRKKYPLEQELEKALT